MQRVLEVALIRPSDRRPFPTRLTAMLQLFRQYPNCTQPNIALGWLLPINLLNIMYKKKCFSLQSAYNFCCVVMEKKPGCCSYRSKPTRFSLKPQAVGWVSQPDIWHWRVGHRSARLRRELLQSPKTMAGLRSALLLLLAVVNLTNGGWRPNR